MKIEIISIEYFSSKMLEKVNYDLIEGQKYFVIHKRGAFVEGDLIYVGNSSFKYPNSIQTFQLNERNYCFYRYISHEEYLKKRKEKYDDTCLNIILKRLVDESFMW
jgi:hypothetical protein